MFDVYDVEAWLLWVPWVLFVVVGIGLAVFWRIAVVLNRSNGIAQAELKKYVAVEGQWTLEETRAMLSTAVKKRHEAEANAREAEAGHRECARKLEETEQKLVQAEDRCQTIQLLYGAMKAKYTPERDSKGHFKRKTGDKKKTSRK